MTATNETAALLKRLGQRMRHLRGTVTFEDAATASGVSDVYIQRIERGTQNPTITILSKLAEAYRVTLGDIFEPWLRHRPAVSGEDEILFDKLRAMLASGGKYREAISVNIDAVYGLFEKDSRKNR